MAKTILVLAANPKNTPPLRLDKEIQEIYNGLERAQKRDEFVLKPILAARATEVRRAMLKYKPNIVHFCGHGIEEGIAFEDESGQAMLVNSETLAGFFELFADKLECVVLNACFSESQAEAVSKHIPYVVGMKKAIGDIAATEFAIAFYDAVGAGESIEFAFKLACNAVEWKNIHQSLIPTLKIKPNNKLVGKISDKARTSGPYSINETALLTLLRDVFKSEEEVKSFTLEYFEGAKDCYTPGVVGLSVMIQSLISYCERYELLENLIGIIQREYPIKYGNFHESLYKPTAARPEASLVINRGVVELRLRGDIDLQRPNIDDFLNDFKKSLVNYFGLELEEVFIMEIRKGSIIVKGVFSELAIEKLRRTNSETLTKEFGIAMIEVLNSILVKIDMRGAKLRNVNWSENDLRSAILMDADLQGAILLGAILRLADLRGAHLRKANLQKADLRGANLSNAKLQQADLRGANLSEAELQGADLSGADLRGTNLSAANLQGADLSGANLSKAILEGAILIGADLRLASIYQADLENTIYDETTKMPSDEIT